jgi:NitT/TauT family transport system substrate-binding protein
MNIRPRVGALLAGLLTVVSLTACGETGPSQPSNQNGLEKATLTVGVSPVPSSAPVYLADQRGFFKEEGLTIKMEMIQAPQAVMPKIKNGSMDAFKGSYVSLLNIQGSGAEKIKILSDTLRGAPGIAGVVVPKDSAIKSPKDLKGKTIGVNSLNNLGTLSVSAHLKASGLTPEDVKFVVIPFEGQLGAVKTGQVDAAWMVEPFLSASKQAGSTLLIDTNVGPTQELPIDGWATTEAWVQQHPKTAAAFQRAIVKAQRLIADDPAILAEVVPGYTQMPKEAVLAMAMGTFPTSLEPGRIQRVADLMTEFGYLKQKIDVNSMIFTAGR